MQKILQVGVKAFLKNTEGKFLLLKRNSKKYNNTKGSWDLSGGRIEPGTSLIENLQREVREETALLITSTLQLICAQDILHYQNTHVVRLTYIAECEGEIILDTTENTEYKWLTLEEMKEQEDLDQYVKEILDKGLI
jgi:ADP-ribose pyrophosphatase YjhB (NUDIX family)